MHYRKGAEEMHIYFAGTQGFDAARAIAPGRGRSAESAAAWSLLLFALRRERGLDALPAIALDASGKPYFPTVSDICFSLSHTRGYVLCALSSVPVGADVQVVSDRDARFASRLMSERERAEFSLHELWCLREAVYKLCGRGSMRSMPFRREGGVIAPPFDGVECRLYADIPGCACAAAAYADTFPDTLVEVRPDRLEKGVVI